MKTFIRPLLNGVFCLVFTSSMAQVPKLSSLPNAPATIFLDFDGHTVEGTMWNYMGPLICLPSTLNSQQITEVFNRISEDYRPFRINITTDSLQFLAAPIDLRVRLIFTVSYEWFGMSGGVAFIGSFGIGDDTPAFVFTSLLNNNVKAVSEAGAHEAGHTLNLYHQSTYDSSCLLVSEYNYGQGNGEIGWAPIMGMGTQRNFTLWNNGPSVYGCTNYVNELSTISNLVGLRSDDHNDVFNRATKITLNNNQFTESGVIERTLDQDIFKWRITKTQRINLNVRPFCVGEGNAGANLDLQVSLYNNSLELLQTYNPETVLSVMVDTILNPGTYYFKVEGRGNANAPHYASLGAYTLAGTVFPPEISRSQNENNDREFNSSEANDKASKSIVQNGKISWPEVISNPINSEIRINSSGIFQYRLLAVGGEAIIEGKLDMGYQTIQLPTIGNGIYILRFVKDGHSHIVKLVRQ